MRISPDKQLLLSALLGPFGLFNVSVTAALALIALTLGAIYLAPAQWILIVATSIIVSMIVGVFLARRNNRILDRDFQRSTHRGDVSCKVVRHEGAQRDYDAALRKARNRKSTNKLVVGGLATACIAAAGLLAIPSVRQAGHSAIGNVVAGAAEETRTDEAIQAQNEPAVVTNNSKVTDGIVTLGAKEYEESSYGHYRPKIKLVCERERYTVSFITDEILGTDTIGLAIKFDDLPQTEWQWSLTDTYQVATAPDARGFVRSLSLAESLSVSYMPFGSEVKKVAEFELTENASDIVGLKNQCEPNIIVSEPEFQTALPEPEMHTTLQETGPETGPETGSSQALPETEPEFQAALRGPEIQQTSPVIEPEQAVTQPDLQQALPEPEFQRALPASGQTVPKVELQQVLPELPETPRYHFPIPGHY